MRELPHADRADGPDDRTALIAERAQGRKGVGAREAERPALLRREALLEHEEAEQHVDQRQSGGGEEGHPRTDLAEQAAERGTDDEAEPERHAHQPEAGGALLGRGDIGDVGVSSRVACARQSRDDPPGDQPAEAGREALHQIVDSETGEARQQLANAQGMLDEARAELGSRRTEVATADTQLEALGRRKDEAQHRFERVMAETEQHRDRAKELEREGKKVNEALATLRQTRLDLGSQNEHFSARFELLTDEVQRGEAEVEMLRTELHRRRSRLTSLVEIQERYEGFQRGTRAVMQGATDIAPDAIRGVVADVVRAPEQLEIAVEAALGDRLGGVLVSEPEVGLAAIGYLKQGGGGRSAFVPIETKSAVPQPVGPTASQPTFEGEGGSASWMSPAWDDAPRGKIEVEDRTELVSASLAAS